jgi:hypothetical protein
MAPLSEKLAQALEVLHSFQEREIIAIKSDEISRVNRERLIKAGFIKEIIRGWYIPSNPGEKQGDTTSWYSSYWEFCARFLKEKYNSDWIVSAEQSLLLHAGNWSVPTQLLIKSPAATNYATELPHGTSLFSMRIDLPAPELIDVVKGLRLYSLQASIVFCSANTFVQNPIDARVALSMIRDSSEILRVLLAGGHSTYAGRVAGAFRNIGRDRIADEIVSTMKGAGYDIRETDPFQNRIDVDFQRERSPYINRLRLMWQQMREVVVRNFPPAPGIAPEHEAYLKAVDDIYVTDAYHSLSIERYRVSPELIERVRGGQWDIHANEQDRNQRDAMAALGYWHSFLKVKESVVKILNGENAGTVADLDHGRWYFELFSPSVTAGLLRPEDLAGYRNSQVYIGGSKHVPVNVEAVRDTMPVLFELLASEPEASVRTVLGHFIFVYIHPYMDGNGRMGRFLMNAMLASGGYPWTVIPVERRNDYMQALDSASSRQNIEPFARFIGGLVAAAMDGRPMATLQN